MKSYENKIKALMSAKDNEGLVELLIDLYLKYDLKTFDEDVLYDLFMYTMDHFEFGKFGQFILLSDAVAAFANAIGTVTGRRLHYEVVSATMYLMGDFKNAIEIMEEYIFFCLDNGFERYEYLLRGNKLTLELELKDYKAAKESIDYMLTLEPEEGQNTVFHVNKVRYLLENNILEGVLENLEIAIKRDGVEKEYVNYIEINLYYAKYFALIKDKEKSLAWYKKTIDLIEEHDLGFGERRVYKELAEMLESHGMYKESNVYLKKYAETLEVAEREYRLLQGKKSQLERYISKQRFEKDRLIERNKTIELENNMDFLTGIYNRRYITNYLNELLEMTKTSEKYFSVLIFDVDDFKNINDNLGHLAGDVIIREVANAVNDMLGDKDRMARTGGDEFIICFEDKNKREAKEISDHIRRRLEQTTFDYDGYPIKVTISGGISDTCELKELNYSTILQRADQKLYQSKEEGKNRIVC